MREAMKHLRAASDASLLARQILEPVGNSANQFQAQQSKLTGFLAMRGHLYNHELMVVGRCVNGWMPCPVLPCQFADATFRNRYAAEVHQASLCHPTGGQQGQCPMNWLMENNPDRNMPFWQTPFWRVVRGVIQGVEQQATDRNWQSHLVWSNLYKLSPWECGTPGAKLRDIQLAGCIALFQLEIEIYRPKRLLLIVEKNGANYGDWHHATDPFLCALNVHEVPVVRKQHVRRAGRLTLPDGWQTCFVDARRPEYQPKSTWIREVHQAFQLLE